MSILIFENTGKSKAGVIPYFIDLANRKILVCTMIPSDPAYGGTSPQFPKGHVDAGENPQQAAVREAQEEVGLLPANVLSVWPIDKVMYAGALGTYDMFWYAAQLKSQALGKAHFETGAVDWHDSRQLLSIIRKNQLEIYKKFLEMATNKLISS